MKSKKLLALLCLASSTLLFGEQWGGAFAQVAHFPMSLSGGNITETVGGGQYKVNSQLAACTVEGLDGDALLFDGWSNYIQAALPAGINTSEFTLTVLLAPQTYPMMTLDVAEDKPTYGTICGNLSDDGKSGFALQLSSQGDIMAAFGSAYAGGYARTMAGSKKLPRGKWSRLTFVYSKSANTVALYLDAEAIATAKAQNYAMNPSSQPFMIGKDSKVITGYGKQNLNINTYVGLIDDIAIYDKAMTADEVAAMKPADVKPDFNYPASRYNASQGREYLWRPQFHGMPSAGWTNESHGLTYSDGKYHVFFQKNANGPYMSRLHWGHITSENLCKWHEEVIAFGPDQSYDMKGCWSGAVFIDKDLTAGKPGILYTAVDNAKATIAMATPVDDALVEWNKLANNPIINGRPQGLSDDFRDPYFFTHNGEKYIIVGTSKDGKGACTLHKYIPSQGAAGAGSWTNDGSIFFQATNASQQGRFWEMPNITRMGDDKWLFTCTPLDINGGVHTICWVGTIGNDGKFTPISDMQTLELNGTSKDGYGLLSPSFLVAPDGMVGGNERILLGIVPDKLPLERNMEIGWAHNYSLPRQLSLDANNKLVQKPYAGLAVMRTATTATANLTAAGTQSLAPVQGRQIEVSADFVANSGTGGISFLKSGDRKATLTYDATDNRITLDLTSLDRTVNDGVYGGKYTASLPERPVAGSTVNVHLFFDGSIADIFIAGKWAFSVRIFPNDVNAVGVDVFTTGSVTATAQAWTLDADGGDPSGIETVSIGDSHVASNTGIFSMTGQQLSSAPQHGIYIIGGKKCLAN